MTPEILSALAGTILSLIFSYLPGVSTWFATLSSQAKSGIFALLMIAVGAAVYGLSCASVLESVPCTQAGLVKLITVIFAALVASQATYQLSPPKHPKLPPVAPPVPPVA